MVPRLAITRLLSGGNRYVPLSHSLSMNEPSNLRAASFWCWNAFLLWCLKTLWNKHSTTLYPYIVYFSIHYLVNILYTTRIIATIYWIILFFKGFVPAFLMKTSDASFAADRRRQEASPCLRAEMVRWKKVAASKRELSTGSQWTPGRCEQASEAPGSESNWSYDRWPFQWLAWMHSKSSSRRMWTPGASGPDSWPRRPACGRERLGQISSGCESVAL